MTASPLKNIPEELRSYPQWICHDAAKRPINPHTGRLADVSEPATWGAFDQACAACDAGSGVGLGFVFTENDPFTGLDLDVPEGGTASPLQQQVYAAFPSYAEPPQPTHNSVVYFDPTTDRVLTPLPHAKKIMLVPHWPSEDAWAEAAIAQQTQLINSAA